MAETLSSEISPRTIGTAQWWQDRASAFEGLDKSLYLEEIIEELEGIEQRKYLRIQGSTDLSRSQFENWATEIGLVLNPPPGVEPFQHFCDELRKDQEENNEDYRRRPAGNEVVSTTKVRTGGEVRKEDRAGLAKWSKALLAAEVIINEAALKNIQRRKKVKAQRARINKEERRKKRRIAEKTVFDKAIEIAPRYGVPPQVILARKQDKYVETTTRTTCTIPNPGQAAASFCTRLAQRARLEAEVMETPADTQQTEVDVGETTESGLPKPVLEGKRCAKVIDEVSRIKNFHASGGRTMNEIREEWPNYEVWRIVEQLPQEDQETFERPSMWGPKIGYARLILSKHYGNSTDTINDWVKAYKKHERSKNQKN